MSHSRFDFLKQDPEIDESVRPSRLTEFIGQKKHRENLKVFIEAAKKRGETLEHLLLCGPPGLGKTTLARIVANELGVNIFTTSGPVLERRADLAGILTQLKRGDVLFIDEIHRLSSNVEEYLYPAMEDFKLDVVLGDGAHARTITLDLEPFTLIGATTRTGLLTSPLRDRFGIIIRLDYYPTEELIKIIKRSSRILKINVSDDGIRHIAKRSRGTPRIANRLLRRARDFAEVEGDGTVTGKIAKEALDRLDIDEMGLDFMDRKILTTIVKKFGGGPVGLKTLSTAVGEHPNTIEEVYEPYLVKKGLIQTTPRGRIATDAAFKHLGIYKNRSGNQSTLF